MLPLVLIFSLVHFFGQIACQGDIVFPVDATDGDSCTLKNGRIGQCQSFSKCGEKFSDNMNICGYFGIELIVCCDVVRRQCAAIVPVLQRISDHMVGVVDNAEVGEFPFMALIKYKSRSENEDLSHARCGAAMVSKRYLLTAAHCVNKGEQLKPYSVILGTIYANATGAVSYLIHSVYWHEKYKSRRRQNDIGIIKLKIDIILNRHIQPICLYTDPEDLPESVDLTVMGWGQGEDGNACFDSLLRIASNNRHLPFAEKSSSVLLKGTVNPIPRTICQARFDVGLEKRILLRETHMCALGDQDEDGIATDACQGDSGGPLVLNEDGKHYLVAIASTGQGCGSDLYAGIYTRVNKYISWIIEKGAFSNL